MKVSSGVLFHFTDRAENLIGILENEFRPRFCFEDFRDLQIQIGHPHFDEHAIPMVCFCDLPLSQISEHLEFYGKYGIGLNKSWGLKSGLNPVLYLTDKSMTNSLFRKVLLHAESKGTKEAFMDITELFAFIKPLEGTMLRRGEPVKRSFYNEREWRFVPRLEPDPENVSRNDYRLSKEEYLDDIRRAHANQQLAERARLSFEPNDIKYIVVEKEREIQSMIRAIRAIKQKYDSDIVDLLSSRILSAEQIEDDF